MVSFWHTRQRSSSAMVSTRASSTGSSDAGRPPWRPRRQRQRAGQQRASTSAAPASASASSHVRQAPSFLTSGMMSSRSTSGVTGPICLKRITPCLSMTKVSGTP